MKALGFIKPLQACAVKPSSDICLPTAPKISFAQVGSSTFASPACEDGAVPLAAFNFSPYDRREQRPLLLTDRSSYLRVADLSLGFWRLLFAQHAAGSTTKRRCNHRFLFTTNGLPAVVMSVQVPSNAASFIEPQHRHFATARAEGRNVRSSQS